MTLIEMLINRLKQSTAPDPDLDRLIHRVVAPDDAGVAPEYTRRATAALLAFPDRSPRALCIAALKAHSDGEDGKR